MATSRASTARAAVDLTFEELYRGHRDDVYRAALRELGNAHDAEDVTQAAFADAYRAVLRGTRPQSPRAWLLAISENVRRRRFRTAQRRPREELVDDADFPLAAELPYDQSRALAEALAALPTEQRRVFVLREIVGLSYAEIAEEIDSTVASIQMLLFRARRSLRDVLDPPTVAIPRRAFLPPLPGWLAATLSRVEISALTPRAAGALGATVLTIAGASVAVPAPNADAGGGAVSARQSAAAATPAAAGEVTKSTARVASQPAVRAGAVRTATRRERRSRPVSAGTPTVTPTAADPIPAPAAVPVAAAADAAPATQPVRVAVTLVDRLVETPERLPVPTDSLPVPLPVQLPSVPSLLDPVVDPVEAATGAAGAAGASAPPLPVPAVPLPTLPHAP